MDLVVGSTGVVGCEICALLVKAGKKVRGLTRAQSDPGRVSDAAYPNVTLVNINDHVKQITS